jgi:hypothetical protein
MSLAMQLSLILLPQPLKSLLLQVGPLLSDDYYYLRCVTQKIYIINHKNKYNTRMEKDLGRTKEKE